MSSLGLPASYEVNQLIVLSLGDAWSPSISNRKTESQTKGRVEVWTPASFTLPLGSPCAEKGWRNPRRPERWLGGVNLLMTRRGPGPPAPAEQPEGGGAQENGRQGPVATLSRLGLPPALVWAPGQEQ